MSLSLLWQVRINPLAGQLSGTRRQREMADIGFIHATPQQVLSRVPGDDPP